MKPEGLRQPEKGSRARMCPENEALGVLFTLAVVTVTGTGQQTFPLSSVINGACLAVSCRGWKRLPTQGRGRDRTLSRRVRLAGS